MTAEAANKGLVLVEFEYEYTSRDGSRVSIKPNERYILISKTNDHWWHVRKDENAKPFYIPANYVKELPSDLPSPLDTVRPNGLTTPGLLPNKKPAALLEVKPDEIAIRPRSRSSCSRKPESRMSTFGIPRDLQDLKRQADSGKPQQTHSTAAAAPSPLPKEGSHHTKRYSLAPSLLPGSRSAVDNVQQSSSVPRPPALSPADPVPKPTQPRPAEPPAIKADLMEPPVGFRDKADLPPDSENIYETIPDVQEANSKKPAVTDAVLVPDPPSIPACNPTEAPPIAPRSARNPRPPVKVKSESPSTAVYVNVAELRNSYPPSLPSPSPLPSPRTSRHLSLDLEGWEVHTDQESGQDFYYHPTTGQTTWDNPFSLPPDPEAPAGVPSSSLPAEPPAPSPPPSATSASDWEQHLDEVSGQPYFYNPLTGETSWDPPEQLSSSPPSMEPAGVQDDVPPPLPEEDYPSDSHEVPGALPTFPKEYTFSHVKRTTIPRASLDTSAPAGWTRSVDPDGKWVFTNDSTQEQWIKSLDDRGQAYYYLRDGSISQWSLPEVPITSGQPRVGNGVDEDGASVVKNWRHTMCPSQFSTTQDDVKFHPTHRRNISDYGSDVSSSGNSPELPHADRFKHRRNPSNQSSDSQHHNTQTLEKAGILNKTKICENGKRVRKNWTQSWTVLHGGVLTFHKDPKSAPGGTSNKTNQIVPEFTLELRGAIIGWASKDKSSKKNVLELKTRSGAEFLIQYDTESIINDWHKVIVDTIRQLDLDHHSEEEEAESSEKSPRLEDKKRITTRSSMSSSSAEADQKKVRTKLLKFLQKRPTLQSVKEKGYIRENVFGCHLLTLCAQEKTTIPSFVEKCIKAVERRGLDIDGIYRVSGNLAVIQKLRFKADHEELDLEDGQWEDVHVITGALKLFFRELPEPLFPYSHFSSFITAINMNDYSQKVTYMRTLVKSLPQPNQDTMELLFRHLRNVIEFGEENRMSVQNVAIVFGPTLLRPETESANITMHMVFQNQIVELILNEYEHIFYPG